MLGTRIAALRREAGLSQAELAQRLQVSPSALGMYEQERREPSMQTLVKLSRELGVTTDYLLGRETSLCADLSGLSEEAAGHVLLLIDDLRRAADLRNT